MFALESKPKSDATEQFISLEPVLTKGMNFASQIGQVKTLLTSIGSKKEGTNFEAGSYMATLEYTMRSISGIKKMI